jgi:uncharacterized membrane-anchored protein
MIRDVEPPRCQSQVEHAERQAARRSRNLRQMEPGGLSRLLRGDLDWIVMKALEKDRHAALRISRSVRGGHRPVSR